MSRDENLLVEMDKTLRSIVALRMEPRPQRDGEPPLVAPTLRVVVVAVAVAVVVLVLLLVLVLVVVSVSVVISPVIIKHLLHQLTD